MRTHVEVVTRRENTLFQPTEQGWRTNADFIYKAIFPMFRDRRVVSARAFQVRKLGPYTRMRARMVHADLKAFRQLYDDISWKQADDAYLDVLRQDGASPAFITWRRIWLRVTGFLRKAGKYWYLPEHRRPRQSAPSEPTIEEVTNSEE